MKYITLTKGAVAVVDDEDFEILSTKKWYYSSMGYAQRTDHNKGNRKEILMHRFVLNAPENREVDHINRNPLDNRKCNLRLCTRSENNHNKGINKNNKSGFKGVYFHRGANKWSSQIMVNRKRLNLGLFSKPLEAFNARKKYELTTF